MRESLDTYYLQLPALTQGCFLAIRDHILAYDPHITEAWKYRTPFFCYRNKIMCYLWTNRKTRRKHYLGVMDGRFIDHPQLPRRTRPGEGIYA